MKKPVSVDMVREGACALTGVCPLSSMRAGKPSAASKASPRRVREVMDRLREMGFCEEQQVKSS